MTVFQLSDESSAADLLGLWRDDPATVAFDGQEAAADVQVWRADLPADTGLARDRLAALQARLEQSRAALSRAADEPELVAWPAGSVEFAAAAGWWRDACGDLADLVGRVARACSPTALIETCVGGEAVGRSLVGLRGEVRTAWRAGGGQAEALLHESMVALALATRATLLRMVALVMRTAPTMAVRLALPFPLGPLLALPAAWRAVQGVINSGQERDDAEIR
ncbi:MAG: hypothetical protein ACRD0K_09905 [Egibacteraceae bacterium]